MDEESIDLDMRRECACDRDLYGVMAAVTYKQSGRWLVIYRWLPFLVICRSTSTWGDDLAIVWVLGPIASLRRNFKRGVAAASTPTR